MSTFGFITIAFGEFLPSLRQHAFAAVGGKYLYANQQDKHIKNLKFTLNGVGVERFPKFNGGLYFFLETNASRIAPTKNHLSACIGVPV
jgi:hypothetical protein